MTATASDRLSRLESIGLGLVAIGVAVLLIESSVEAYAIPRHFVDGVLEWPPHLTLAAAVGAVSCVVSVFRRAKAPFPRVAVVVTMLFCGITLVGTLAIAYGYAFLMSGFD